MASLIDEFKDMFNLKSKDEKLLAELEKWKQESEAWKQKAIKSVNIGPDLVGNGVNP